MTLEAKRQYLIKDYATRCARHRRRKANWKVLRDLTTKLIKRELRSSK